MHYRFLALAALSALLMHHTAPAAHAQSESIRVFGLGRVEHLLADWGRIRRGTSSEVTIFKNFIDLTSSVSATGATLSGITKGNQGGIGFQKMTVTVPAGQSLGRSVTIKVGDSSFPLTVTHKGEITNISYSPSPSTVTFGTAVNVVVTGTDFGTAALSMPCHNETYPSRSATGMTATITGKPSTTLVTNVGISGQTCDGTTTTRYSIVGAPAAENEPAKYAFSTGRVGHDLPAYRAAVTTPPPVVACASQSIAQPPSFSRPFATSGQVLRMAAGTVSPTPVSITWNPPANVVPPNNEYLLEIPTFGARTSVVTRDRMTVTVVGTRYTLNVPIPSDIAVTVRPKNCGLAAPSASLNFSVTF